MLYNGRMITIIAAMDGNRGLGFDNKLPWHLPDDLKRFKVLTKGHPIIMGRKTYESIGRILPERKNIIITRNAEYQASGCVVVGSIEEAIAEAHKDDNQIFIIGGSEIYKLGLPFADMLCLTFVDADIPADVFFPEFDSAKWNVTQEEFHSADEKHPYPFAFRVYEKKK